MKERSAAHGFTRMVEGLALGAVAMYMLDPDKGRRRRGLLRDQLQRFGNDATRLTHQAARDASNRLHGVTARVHRRIGQGDADLDELRLIERVRSAIGRIITHPHAIQVGARGDTVVVSGPILSHEVPDLIACVRSVPGVADVENHLATHAPGDRVPSLQGAGRRRADGHGPTPMLRFASLAGGGVLALYGLGKRGVFGLLVAAAGVTMARRAVDGAGVTAGERRLGAAWAGAQGSADPARVGADGTPAGAPRHDLSAKDARIGGVPGHVPAIGNDGTGAGRGTDAPDGSGNAGRARRTTAGGNDGGVPPSSAAPDVSTIDRPPSSH